MNFAAVSKATLSDVIGVDFRVLQAVAERKEELYQPLTVPGNRRKNRRERSVTAPTKELRHIQRRLLRGLFAQLQPHRASYCVKGRGVLKAVRVHAGKPALLHLDIKRFYASATRQQVLERLL